MGLMGPNVLEMNGNEVANNLGTTCTVKQKWYPGMILTAPVHISQVPRRYSS